MMEPVSFHHFDSPHQYFNVGQVLVSCGSPKICHPVGIHHLVIIVVDGGDDFYVDRVDTIDFDSINGSSG